MNGAGVLAFRRILHTTELGACCRRCPEAERTEVSPRRLELVGWKGGGSFPAKPEKAFSENFDLLK